MILNLNILYRYNCRYKSMKKLVIYIQLDEPAQARVKLYSSISNMMGNCYWNIYIYINSVYTKYPNNLKYMLDILE